MIDNSVTHNADQEWDKRGSCPNCGGNLEDIRYCIDFCAECSEDCNSYNPKYDCPNREDRVRCSNCETIFEGA